MAIGRTLLQVRRRTSIAESPALVIVALLILVMCAGWLDPRADAINKANSLLRDGSYDEALRLYENVVVEHPDELTGRLNSAIALYAAGRYEDSSARFSEVLERIAARAERSTETTSLIERISCYGAGSAEFRLGSAAETLANSAPGSVAGPALAPGDPSTPTGSVDVAISHYRQATRHFRDALRLDPGDDDVRHNYRLSYERLKELEQSLQSGETEAGETETTGPQTGEDSERSEQDEEESQSGVAQSEEDPSDPEEQRGEGGHAQGQDRVSLSLEEALRLLEMMSEEEARGMLVERGDAEESLDYPNW